MNPTLGIDSVTQTLLCKYLSNTGQPFGRVGVASLETAPEDSDGVEDIAKVTTLKERFPIMAVECCRDLGPRLPLERRGVIRAVVSSR